MEKFRGELDNQDSESSVEEMLAQLGFEQDGERSELRREVIESGMRMERSELGEAIGRYKDGHREFIDQFAREEQATRQIGLELDISLIYRDLVQANYGLRENVGEWRTDMYDIMLETLEDALYFAQSVGFDEMIEVIRREIEREIEFE